MGMMNIISTTHGYVITDELTFVKTFWLRHYNSQQECFFDAISTIVLMESIWGHTNNQTRRGRILLKAGIIREGFVGRPHKVKV